MKCPFVWWSFHTGCSFKLLNVCLEFWYSHNTIMCRLVVPLNRKPQSKLWRMRVICCAYDFVSVQIQFLLFLFILLMYIYVYIYILNCIYTFTNESFDLQENIYIID